MPYETVHRCLECKYIDHDIFPINAIKHQKETNHEVEEVEEYYEEDM